MFIRPVNSVNPVSQVGAAPRVSQLLPVERDYAARKAAFRSPLTAQGVAPLPGDEREAPKAVQAGDANALKRLDQIECQTCNERRYVDGSDDGTVSYQSPTRIAPEKAAAAVRSHEREHVVNERRDARRSGREIVSQSVRLSTSICPECGKAYVSGGETVTTTRGPAQSAARGQSDALATPYKSMKVDERS